MDNIYSRISVFLFIFPTVFCATESPNDICSSVKENTTCTLVTSCPHVMKLLSAENRDIVAITKLNCGYEGTSPKVCCSNKEEIPISYNTTEEIATNRPKPKPRTTTKSIVTSTIAPHTTEKTDIAFPSKTECGKDTRNENRVAGGIITGIDEHPWLARIGYKTDNELVFGCSATLITDRYLLTAAHCVVRNLTYSIRLGEWNTKTNIDCYMNICNNKTIDLEIKQKILHPTFQQSKHTDGDIALIQTIKAVEFTDFIKPICLPTTKYIAMQDYSSDSVYFTAGWGLTEFESESDVKRQVELKAAPIEVCRNIYKLKAESESNIICAGGTKGKDTCRGDSGGALIKEVPEDYQINWYVFGITSRGLGNCGAEGVPGIYTRVSVYMDWIRAIVSS